MNQNKITVKTKEISEIKKKSRQERPKVSIIVLNWNNYNDTKRCLGSIKKIDYPNYKVIVVDNGSNDGSREKLKREFPFYTFILNRKNLGYAGGNNVGIKRAMNKSLDINLILNNDTKIINPKFLDEAVSQMERNPSIGIMGPKVLNPGGNIQDTILFVPTLLNSIKESLFFKIHKKTKKNYNIPQFVGAVSGVCWLIRREVIQNIGLLDEDYFMYVEEKDYCYRAEKAGWKIIYYPVESIIHYKNPGDKNISRTYRQYIHTRRNTILFIRKHFGFLQALMLSMLFLVSNVLKVVFSKFTRKKEKFYTLSLLLKLFSEIKYVLYMERENDKTK